MPEIEKHLHQLTRLIREQDSIKLVVKLESSIGTKIRYLAVVSCIEQESEEFCLLGVDCDQDISLGLVLAILSYTTIRLDGDGGFCVTTSDGLRSHIFKPVSVQTMWSALQSLYRASECAKENNSFQASAVRYYEDVFSSYKSDPGCLTEWNILPGVENRRPLASAFTSEELSFQERISCTLREILLCERDLDEVTSKEIRTKLEYKLKVDLSHYKSFIDEEMLKILGQMEAPALILDHLYLGTEWNASHQQDLFDKDIKYILNVTTEIDNFFPDTFRYMNIPVCDTEETDILRHFNDSYKFINKARKDGKNVLVHCKMGISRSATIVIAYVMKTRNWDLCKSLKQVKERRNCVKPNPNFMKQLEVYEGILTAKRFSTTLEKRSKSESNLKQSDKSMLLPRSSNDRVIMCSSNSDITDGADMLKSHKKYFNTAPARLKPEKNGRKLVEFDILKPKSSSCSSVSGAAILTENELRDIVPADVLSSFEAAVSVLENNPSGSNSNSYCDVQEARLTTPTFSLEIPVVTVTAEDEPIEFMPIEPSSLNYFVANEKPTTMNFEPLSSLENINNNDGDDHNDAPAPVSAVVTTTTNNNNNNNSICMTSIPPPPPFEEDDEDSVPMDTTSEEFLSHHQPECSSSSTEESKKAMNLKCCRRPYNGHTFSVSPNQVVNITSIVDCSKFSVRHLVNEFEQQSKGSILGGIGGGNGGSSGESTNALEILSHKSARSPHRTKVRARLLNNCDTDYTSSEDNQEESDDVVPILPQLLMTGDNNISLMSPSGGGGGPTSLRDLQHTTKSSKKGEKLGCLPFFRKYSSSMSKSSQNKNAVSPGGSGHSKKSNSSSGGGGDSKSRKGKILDTVAKLSENGDCISPLEHQLPAKYQSTGVVKQRLEAFEAKAVPPHSKHQLFFRSHNRSHSATGSSGSLQFESLGHLSQRKSSMPQLGSKSCSEFDSPTFSRLPLIQTSTSSDRKASLDSNGLFKTFPCPLVRGFQNNSGSKSFFSTSPNSSSRVQHGSTHPLNLLPRTPTLT